MLSKDKNTPIYEGKNFFTTKYQKDFQERSSLEKT